jgi:hypothetical protein
MSAGKLKCAACGSTHWIKPACFDVTICFFCGSWLEANSLLLSHQLQPREIYQLLSVAPRFAGITIEVARSAIEAFRSRHDKPN